MAEPGIIKGELSDELIAQLVTSENVGARTYGRLLATGMAASIEDWLNAEVRRGTQEADIMVAVVSLSANTIGSLLLQKVTRYLPVEQQQEALAPVLELLRQRFDTIVLKLTADVVEAPHG